MSFRQLVIGAMVVATSLTVRAELARHDGPGNLRSMNMGGRFLSVSTEIRMPSQGWSTSATSARWSVSNASFSESGGEQRWSGQARQGNSTWFSFQQTGRQVDDHLELSIQVTSATNASLEGIFFFISVAVSDFAGGIGAIQNGPGQVTIVRLPPNNTPGSPHLLARLGDGIVLKDADDNIQLEIGADRAMSATIQDNREWNNPFYATFFQIHSGSLPAGQTASASFTFRLTGVPDAAPALLDIEKAASDFVFDGWGGNFVFNTNAPETQFMLQNLRVAWARTQASLRTWEPSNDNSDPHQTDWSRFAGIGLRQEFEFARQIEMLGIPRIASTWWLPQWLHPEDGTVLPRAKWDELAECATSYLLYGKEHYGVEPDFYSFNEPDIGVYLKQTPEEHRDLIKLFGERFAAAGLRTKLLLGDVASPNADTTFAQPATLDDEALSRVTAVSVHSWAGDDYADWIAGMQDWSRLAADIDRPFLVTEVGADASAWNFAWMFRQFGYAMDDLRNYLNVLRHGRPRSALQWELTSDYGLAYSAGGQVVPTKRFWMVKQLSNVTPAASSYLETRTDCTDLIPVGFARHTANALTTTLHIGNFGPGRQLTVTGLPTALNRLFVFRTSETENLEQIGVVLVRGGSAVVDLAPQSLTTLVGRCGFRRPRTRR